LWVTSDNQIDAAARTTKALGYCPPSGRSDGAVSCSRSRLMPVEQPSDQLGSLLQLLLLDGIHPDIGEVGFNAIKHPRQRHIERKKRMIEIGRVQFGFVALTTFYGCPAPTGNNIAYLIGGG